MALHFSLPVHRRRSAQDAVGDDGLTDAQRQESAERYQAGPAAKFTRAEMAEIRARLADRARTGRLPS